MRRLAMLIVVAVVAASCAQTVNVEQENAALLARDAEWATTGADPARRASFLAPDAVVLQNHAPVAKGVAAIQAMYDAEAKLPGVKVGWKPTAATVAASGDLGYTVGTYEFTANNAAGLPDTVKGKYVTTWKKIDGTWKVTVDVGTPDTPAAVSSPHVVVPAAAIKWGEPPPSVPPGAKMAVVSGDPSQPGPFTVRAQMPSGYRLAPHWHPTDEHITVLSGTFAVGMGKTFDDKALKDLPAGSYGVMSATMPHFAITRGATVLQIQGMGPFVLNYVNPADAPATK